MYKVCRYSLLVLFWILWMAIKAQSPPWAWAGSIGGEDTRDDGFPVTLSTIVDSTNDAVYTTGYFIVMVDVDPDAGEVIIEAPGTWNLFVIRWDMDGHFVWVKTIGSPGSFASGNSISLDENGNLIIAGTFNSDVDFDTGPGTHVIWASGDQDGFLLELNPDGEFHWVKNFGGIFTTCYIGSSDFRKETGEIYITGYVQGPVDFDPGPDGFFIGTGNANQSIFYCVYDSVGNFEWAGGINGNSTELFLIGNSIKVSAADGEVYVLGNYYGTCDFDPGPLDALATSNGESDIFLLKLDSLGQFIWVKSFGGSLYDNGAGLDLGYGLDENIYATGNFEGTVDFDPGVGVYNLGPSSMFILKLSGTGNFIWAKENDGALGYAIQVDRLRNESVFTTGGFGGTTDFDPGPGTHNVTVAGALDCYIWKIDSSGQFIWVKTAGGIESEYGYSLELDVSGEAFVAGYVASSSVDFDGDIISNTGFQNAFIARLSSCTSVVINTNDIGYGSLRDVVLCSRSGDTIGFDLPDMSEITLTSGEIEITKDLYLAGTGIYNLSLSGDNKSRIFNLMEGNNFTIEAMTLHETTSVTHGGSVYVKGLLTLHNILLQDNFENGVPKSLTLTNAGSLTIIGNVELKY